MFRPNRTIREEVMEAVDDGFINANTLILSCLNYMSLDDVKDMLHANDIQLPGDMEEE